MPVKKKKAAKKAVVKAPSKKLAISPMGLENIWEQSEVCEAWDNLTDKYQTFLLFYIGAGCRNARKTYHEVVDKTASDDVARNGGFMMLTNTNVGIIFDAMRAGRKQVMRQAVEKVYLEATEAIKPIYGKDEDGQPCHIEDIDDHDIRIKAAKEMAKLGGLNEEKDESTTNQINVQIIQLPEKRSVV